MSEMETLLAKVLSEHTRDNTGVAFDAVGCSCGSWSAKATWSAAKRRAHTAHVAAEQAAELVPFLTQQRADHLPQRMADHLGIGDR